MAVTFLTNEDKNIIDEQIAELQNGGSGSVAIDATLTQQGMAADAKATGDAINSLNEEIANKGNPTNEQVKDAVNAYLEANPIQPDTSLVKAVEGFTPNDDGNVEIKYPIKTGKGYSHDNLPTGNKTITIYNDDKYTNAPHIFLSENFWPSTEYVSGKYAQHGMQFSSDGYSITVQGTATAYSEFYLAAEDGGDAYWSIPDNIALGERYSLYVFSVLNQNSRSPAVKVQFFDADKTHLKDIQTRVAAGNVIATSLNMIVPANAAYMRFTLSCNNGETHDSTFFPVFVKASSEMINSLELSGEASNIETENSTTSIFTAPFTSDVMYDVELKEYIDNNTPNINLEALESLQKKSFITPEEFGAFADGQRDDTAALQACIDFAVEKGKKVIGGGEYVINAPLIVKGDRMSLDIKKITYSGDDCAVIVSGQFNNIRIGSIYADLAAGFRLNSTEEGAETGYNEIYLGRVKAGKNAVEYISSVYDLVSNNLTFGSLRSGSQYCCIYHSPFNMEDDICHVNNNFTGGLLETGQWGVFNAKDHDTYMTCRFEGVKNGIHQSSCGYIRVISPRYSELCNINSIDQASDGHVLYDVSDLPFDYFPRDTKAPPYVGLCLIGGGDVLNVYSIDVSRMPTTRINTEGNEIEPLNKNVPGVYTIHERLRTLAGTVIANSFMLFGNHILIHDPAMRMTKHITGSDSGYAGDYRTTGVDDEFYIYDTYIIDESECVYTLPPSYDAIAFNRFTVIQPEGTRCVLKDWRGTTVFNGEEYGDGSYDIRITTDHRNRLGDYDNNHQIWEIRRMSDYMLVDTMPHEIETTE